MKSAIVRIGRSVKVWMLGAPLGLLLASVLVGAGGALVLLAGGSERRARRP
jgi:hypothetical protein